MSETISSIVQLANKVERFEAVKNRTANGVQVMSTALGLVIFASYRTLKRLQSHQSITCVTVCVTVCYARIFDGIGCYQKRLEFRE